MIITSTYLTLLYYLLLSAIIMGIMALGPRDFIDYVNYDKQSLYSKLAWVLPLCVNSSESNPVYSLVLVSAASIAFNPLFWK